MSSPLAFVFKSIYFEVVYFILLSSVVEPFTLSLRQNSMPIVCGIEAVLKIGNILELDVSSLEEKCFGKALKNYRIFLWNESSFTFFFVWKIVCFHFIFFLPFFATTVTTTLKLKKLYENAPPLKKPIFLIDKKLNRPYSASQELLPVAEATLPKKNLKLSFYLVEISGHWSSRKDSNFDRGIYMNDKY